MLSHRTKDILFIITAGLLLCWLGFYNNFPFVFYDTGAYMYCGFSGTVPHDRPIFYGLILRHISMKDSLWLVILFQGLIVSLSAYYYFRFFVEKEFRNYFFLIYIFLITFFTGASMHVSQLLPDVFAAVALMNYGLLVLSGKLKTRDLIIISALLFISISVHNSHMTICLLLSILISILFCFRRIRRSWTFLSLRRLIYIWSFLIASYLVVSATHLSYGGKFTMAQGKEVFMISRLCDMEILQEYLEEKCPDHHYKLCQYKDSIPWDYLWDYNQSPLYKMGGWGSNLPEYRAILIDLFTTPKYLIKYLSRSFECSFKLFFNFDTGDTPLQNEGTATFTEIHHHFPMHEREYFTSKQSAGRLNFDPLNRVQWYLIGISLFLSIWLLFLRIPKKFRYLILFFLMSLWVNALICGSLSGIYSRYQSRVIWLLPLPLILFLASQEPLKRRLRKAIGQVEKNNSPHGN